MDADAPGADTRPWPRLKAPGANAIAGNVTAAAFLLTFLTILLFLAVLQIANLFLVTEAGYGDSYILYDVWHFQKTGVIYRDLSQPPYLPAVYSPMVYILYAASGWITSANPFFGPRLVALLAFLLCLAVLASIVRLLIPARHAWAWGLLLAGSIRSVGIELWPLQLRGDFPGILFALTAIRLLLARSRYAAFLAGLCAGAAVQFKITYVSAILTGCLWLLLRRRYKELLAFVAAGSLTSAGLYALFALCEPRMISQMLAVRPGIPDVSGCIKLVLSALSEPVVLLALPALPLVIFRPWPRLKLILLFAVTSFTVGALADIQVGGNINYFFEGLFATTPFAVLGVLRLIGWSRRQPALAFFVTGLALIHFLLPALRAISWQSSPISPRAVSSQNDLFRKVEVALHGRRIFSVVPRMALLDPEPPLVEPYLLSYLRRLGKFDAKPMVERLRIQHFDIVITFADRDLSWRGMSLLEGADFADAIASVYKPHCTVLGAVFSLPRTLPEDSLLIQNLRGLGCTVVDAPTPP